MNIRSLLSLSLFLIFIQQSPLWLNWETDVYQPWLNRVYFHPLTIFIVTDQEELDCLSDLILVYKAVKKKMKRAIESDVILFYWHRIISCFIVKPNHLLKPAWIAFFGQVFVFIDQDTEWIWIVQCQERVYRNHTLIFMKGGCFSLINRVQLLLTSPSHRINTLVWLFKTPPRLFWFQKNVENHDCLWLTFFIFRFKLYFWKRGSRESQAPFEPKTSSRSSVAIREASWMTDRTVKSTLDIENEIQSDGMSSNTLWTQLVHRFIKVHFIWIELIRRDKRKRKPIAELLSFPPYVSDRLVFFCKMTTANWIISNPSSSVFRLNWCPVLYHCRSSGLFSDDKRSTSQDRLPLSEPSWLFLSISHIRYTHLCLFTHSHPFYWKQSIELRK